MNVTSGIPRGDDAHGPLGKSSVPQTHRKERIEAGREVGRRAHVLLSFDDGNRFEPGEFCANP